MQEVFDAFQHDSRRPTPRVPPRDPPHPGLLRGEYREAAPPTTPRREIKAEAREARSGGERDESESGKAKAKTNRRKQRGSESETENPPTGWRISQISR